MKNEVHFDVEKVEIGLIRRILTMLAMGKKLPFLARN